MIAKLMRRVLFVAVLGWMVSFAALADAQCCGSGYGYSTYYQPSAYTSYSPVAYTSYYGYYGSGWYPGYWLDRFRARVWGSPSTYVASYPSYYTSYAPSYSAGYATSYAAPAGCSSCSSCSSCSNYPSYSVGYASPCSACTGCSSCAGYSSGCSTCSGCSTAGCSTCSAPAVSQAVYQEPTGCASCAAQGTVVAPSPTMAPPQSQAAPQTTYGQDSGAPAIDPRSNVPMQRQDTQRPANGTDIQPEPATDSDDPYRVNGDSSTYFQAPKLFDPNDRTAQRSPTAVSRPVTMAVYEKPVAYRNVSSTQPITAEQAQADAAGWVSASK